MKSLKPAEDYSKTPLHLSSIPVGARYGRIFVNKYPDPLAYGKTPSRFSDPRQRITKNRFGVLYVGMSLKVCFVETILRDLRDNAPNLPIEESELHERNYAEVTVSTPLSLVDLCGDGALLMGVPTDVKGAARQTLSRLWAVAFHDHPQCPDGILYPSRLNEETNLAIFGRAVSKLVVSHVRPLMRCPELAGVLDELNISLVRVP
jgi:hypothetical protein